MKKTCTGCLVERNIEDFAWKSIKRSLRHARCRDCVSAESRRWYNSNKKRHLASVRKSAPLRIQQNVDIIRNRGWACTRCGEDHPGVLDFHHRDPTEKENDITTLLYSGCSISYIEKELSKCVVLCANCHRKEHWSMRQQRQSEQ